MKQLHDITGDNTSLPLVFEDLTQGIRNRVVPAMDDEGCSDEEEHDDAYLKRVQPRQDADSITDLLIYSPSHYFVIATVLGHMLVFKWDPKLVSSSGQRAQKSHAEDMN